MKARLKECLVHFLANFSDDPVLKKQLLEYLGLKAWDTVVRWRGAKNWPVGDVELRALYLLDALGYDVTELRAMHSRVRAGAQLVGLGIVPFEQVVDLLGMVRQHTYVVLRGDSGTTEDKEVLLGDLAARHTDAVKTKKLELLKVFGSLASEPTVAAPAPSSPTPLPASGGDPVAQLALSAQMLLPLARHVASDACTPDDRRRLREAAGKTTIFDLANVLNELCGEQARAKTRSKGG